ncbi:MAG: hypothetical protein AAGG11_23920 [Pseudomonadota bacterium]
MSTERERLHNLFPELDFDPEALRQKYREERDKQVIEVTAEAEADWVAQIIALAGTGATAFLEECTPGYYNREGRAGQTNMQNSPYAPGINAFNDLLRSWREAGDLHGMTLR